MSAMIIEIDIYPVDKFIKGYPGEIERQIPIRGKNYRGIHHYMLTNEHNNLLRYMRTTVSTTISVEKLKEK